MDDYEKYDWKHVTSNYSILFSKIFGHRDAKFRIVHHTDDQGDVDVTDEVCNSVLSDVILELLGLDEDLYAAEFEIEHYGKS